MKTQQCVGCEKPTNDYYPYQERGKTYCRCVDCHEKNILSMNFRDLTSAVPVHTQMMTKADQVRLQSKRNAKRSKKNRVTVKKGK